LQKGTRKVGDVTYETWEFVKRAGTKGATAGELVALLGQIPRLPTGSLSTSGRALFAKYLRNTITIAEAVEGNLMAAVNALPAANSIRSGGDLCMLVDQLPAEFGSDTAGW